MTRRFIRAVAASILLCQPAFAQTAGSVREYRRANEHRILREFVGLLSLPNVASDVEAIRRNAARLSEMMSARGLEPRLLEAGTPNVPPAVYGEWRTPGATRTVIFYAHYDGQPTDPRKWTGTLPWEPRLRSAPFDRGGTLLPMPADGEAINPEWRLYARSASDDKAGVMAILTAFDALRAKNIRPTVNLKFFFEGEEEAGSPHLVEILSRHKELLASDAWLICDGPVHQSGRKQVVFGVRGDTNVELTVYGPRRPLHSGHYGNWAPNPAMTLARLLASMKDERGARHHQGLVRRRGASGRGRAPRARRSPGLRRGAEARAGHQPPRGRGRVAARTHQPAVAQHQRPDERGDGRALAQRHPHDGRGRARPTPRPRHTTTAGKSSGSSRTCARRGSSSPTASRPTPSDWRTRSSAKIEVSPGGYNAERTSNGLARLARGRRGCADDLDTARRPHAHARRQPPALAHPRDA